MAHKVWRGKTSKIRRIDPYGKDWFDIRKQVLQRDQHRCQKCGSIEHLEVHHIIPVSKGGSNASTNLITVCHRCHRLMPKHRHLR